MVAGGGSSGLVMVAGGGSGMVTVVVGGTEVVGGTVTVGDTETVTVVGFGGAPSGATCRSGSTVGTGTVTTPGGVVAAGPLVLTICSMRKDSRKAATTPSAAMTRTRHHVWACASDLPTGSESGSALIPARWAYCVGSS